MWRACLALAGWETAWWLHRRAKRARVYEQARARASLDGVPLVVVGAPDAGATGGYPCGDVTVDIEGSGCPASLKADVTKRLPFEDGSVVVFVSCVLEYVEDYEAALSELCRISGGRIYIVRVEPWTLAAYFYPGAKRTIPEPTKVAP